MKLFSKFSLYRGAQPPAKSCNSLLFKNRQDTQKLPLSLPLSLLSSVSFSLPSACIRLPLSQMKIPGSSNRFAIFLSSSLLLSVIPRPFKHTLQRNFHTVENSPVYDVFIVGGGVTGTALLYELAKFTNLKKIGLCERRHDFSLIASNPKNNSQTIHCGDIETNYTLTKATSVKRNADILRNFATKLPEDMKNKCVTISPKMALAVGEKECEFMEKRFKEFKTVFNKIMLLSKNKICELEPRVGMVSQTRKRHDQINGIYVTNEHTSVNYYHLAAAFTQEAKNCSDKQIEIHLETEAKSIHHEGKDKFLIETNRGRIMARFVVVSACGHSLLLAQKMGYGLQYSCLPIAGSFYFAPKMLLGKVYTVQNPLLPFAAVHGDPDVVAVGKTRFGPTALPLPMLERYNNDSIYDFFQVVNPDLDLITVYFDLLKSSDIRHYILKNFLYEVPKINILLFAASVRKIVPSIKEEDLTYANGYGGVRPQLVDKQKRKLLLGEGKITPGTGIIFNITPSPGGTTCLGNAEADMRQICDRLSAKIDESALRKTLYEGEYPVQ